MNDKRNDFMRSRGLPILLLAVALLVLWSCAKNQYTNRAQFILISPKQEIAMGLKASEDIKRKERIIRTGPEVRRVRNIGRRIAAVANRPDFEWEFNVVDNPKVRNAFCLPGGKIFVYTGLLNLVDSDDELATVMAHEVAHAIARHGAERYSQQLGLAIGGQVAGALLDINSPGSSALFSQVYGIGTQVGFTLPHSRKTEHEADYIGLILMTKAGYDPDASITFWEKMMAANTKGSPPKWLSTHPPGKDRINALRRAIPTIKQKFGGRPVPYMNQEER